MFFKQKIFCAFSLLFSTACGLNFTSDTESMQNGSSATGAGGGTVSLGNSNTQCLSGYEETMSRYFRGELSEHEISVFWGCAQASIDEFAKNTRGAEAESYRPEEFKAFLEKYFLSPGETIPGAVLDESMHLKQRFVGGSADRITRKELQETGTWIKIFRDLSLNLRPFFPFSLEKISELSAPERDALKSKYSDAINAIGDTFGKTNGVYTYERLWGLIRAFALLKPEQVEEIQKNLPLFNAFKQLTISTETTGIAPSDWKPTLQWGLDFTFLKAENEALIRQRYPSREKYFNQFDRIVSRFAQLLENTVQKQPGGVLRFEDIQNLMRIVGIESFRKKFGAPGLQLDTLLDLVPVVIQRFLGGTDTSVSGRRAPGLTSSGVRRLLEVYASWSVTEHKIAASNTNRTLHIPELFPALPSRKAVFLPGNDFLTFDRRTPDFKTQLWNSHNLSTLNGLRTFAQLLIQGYARDLGRADLNHPDRLALEEEELVQFYMDFWYLGTELKFLDSRTTDAARKRFHEINLFSFFANGDTLLSIEELTDLSTFILSSKSLAKSMYESFLSPCRDKKSPLDPEQGKPQIRTECFRENFIFQMSNVLRPFFPEASDYLTAVNFGILDTEKSAKEKKSIHAEFILSLEKLGRFNPDGTRTGAPIEIGDFDGFALMLHYVEALMSRFDVNMDGHLDESEALRAYPVLFERLRGATEKEGVTDTKTIEHIYTFYLKYGVKPTKGKLIWWMAQRSVGMGGDLRVDRARLLEIFSQF